MVVGGLRPDRQFVHQVHGKLRRPRPHDLRSPHQSADDQLRRTVRLRRDRRNGAPCGAPERDRHRPKRHRRAGRLQRRRHHAGLCSRDGERREPGRRAGWPQRRHHHADLRNRGGERHRQLCRRPGWLQQRRHHAVLCGRDGERRGPGRRPGRQQPRHRHAILLGRNDVGTCGRRRHRKCNRRDRPDHQPDAGSGQLRHHLRGLGFRQRLVGAERRLLSAALRRKLRAARRSRQCVAGLRRCQPGFHLYVLRPAHGRHISHSLRPLAVDGGDDDVQCRQLRDHSGRQRHQHRRAGLSPDPNACRADGHAARDHGDGRRQEPRLWRCQSGADLSGRRLRSGQRRYAVGRAGDVGDDSQQCRRLRHQRRARWRPRATMR